MERKISELPQMELPDLFGSSIEISNDLAADPWDRLPFDNATKQFLKSNYQFEEIEKLFNNWTFEVDSKLTLSQSKIKGLWAVASGDVCPLTYQESLFSKEISIFEESDVMIKGQVFEYLATGQKNYINQVPDLSVLETSTGKETAFSKLMIEQVKVWKEHAKNEGLTRIKTGHVEKVTTSSYSIACTTDLTAKKNGLDIVYDLKLSDPNGKFGLARWHDQELTKADNLLLQAKVTKLIFYKNYLKDVPFVFYIASGSKPEQKARKIVFKDFKGMIKEIDQLVKETYSGVKFCVDFGLFKAEPDVKNCSFCKVNCFKKISVVNVKDLEV